jgi:MFS family permease
LRQKESPTPVLSGVTGGWAAGGISHGPAHFTRAMFSSLADRKFLITWGSNMCAMFAMNMQILARGWLIYDLTQSAMALALVMAAFMLPMLIFSILGGVIADRANKKYVMVISQCFNVAATLTLATIIITGNVRLIDFLVVGFINGLVLALSMPSRQAIISEIIGPAGLVNAFALNNASMNLSRILGPSIAGVLIALFGAGETSSTTGVGIIFYIISAMYVCSIILLLFLQHGSLRSKHAKRSVFQDILEGLKYINGKSVILGLLIISFVPLIFGMPVQFLLPVFNETVLNRGPIGLGLLMTFMGVGALGGSLLLAYIGDTRRKGSILLGCVMGWALFLGLFGVSSNLVMALVFLGAVGFFSSIFMSLNMTIIQLACIPEMRGRVMSIMMMSFGLLPVGIFPLSIMADSLGIANALLISAIGLGGLILLVSLFFPSVRRIDRGYDIPITASE